eukprot:14902364-Alexandrium_andersonii.AAC.1
MTTANVARANTCHLAAWCSLYLPIGLAAYVSARRPIYLSADLPVDLSIYCSSTGRPIHLSIESIG